MGTRGQTTWDAMSRESLEAARELVRMGKPRSAASRAYFSAYASAHAILAQFNEHPPDRGNWSHAALPTALGATLGRGGNRQARAAALLLKQSLAKCWISRIVADYGPGATLDADAAQSALRDATRLFRRMEAQR